MKKIPRLIFTGLIAASGGCAFTPQASGSGDHHRARRGKQCDHSPVASVECRVGRARRAGDFIAERHQFAPERRHGDGFVFDDEDALRAGAKGYLMKDADGPTFLAAIRRVISGQIYMSAQLAARVLDAFAGARPRGSSSPLEKLSDRAFEVFRLFGEGKTAKEIAGQLNLSPKTVSVHRDHIKEKLQFTTSAAMIRQAVRYVEAERLGGDGDGDRPVPRPGR